MSVSTPIPAAAAGDINFDGGVTITDFLKVKSFLLGLEGIGGASGAGEPVMLMVPETSEVWKDGAGTEGAASFASDNDAIATIGSDGTVTAVGAGSVFVYALDGSGNVLARTMVTVLNDKLTVSLSAATNHLIMGQTLTLSATLNHPVQAAMAWTSSDESIVTVDGSGTLTAHNFGTAVVTVSLGNGSKAETTVTVAPPITDIEFGKSLYKIKPGSSRNLGIVMTPSDTGEEVIWTSSDNSIATVGADDTVTGVKYGTVTITAKGKYSGLSASCKVKICNAKYVAITFDDGPSSYTTGLLDFLNQNDIKATFFLVCNRIPSYPDIVKRQVAEGHEMGYHSYAHVMQTSLSSEQIKSDFNKSNNMLKELTGAEFTVWRSPGGDYNQRVLDCIPVPHIYWSVDTRDWATLNASSVYSSIMNYSTDGSIILLHDLYGTSVNGAISAMKQMNAGDYEFMTVTELLSRNGTPPKASTNYYNG